LIIDVQRPLCYVRMSLKFCKKNQSQGGNPPLSFNPEFCRNESEVESKLIVSYLLPKLGYTPDSWHQEVAFGNIRLDFLSFATQVIPMVIDVDSPLSVVIEAKHPNQKLDRHLGRLKRYLTSLSIRYGLITNAKEIRIYEVVSNDFKLVFNCLGKDIDSKIGEIIALIGKENLRKIINNDLPSNDVSLNAEIPSSPSSEKLLQPRTNTINPQLTSHQVSQPKKEPTMKVIAVYHNKGGVGKTTTVVNLAAALSKKGYRVLVIDLDSQANTTFATGLIKFDDEALDNLKDCNILHVLRSEEFFSISEVTRKSQFNNPEIDVVPSHIDLMQYESELNQLDYSRLILIQKLTEEEKKYDIVIIDTPPSLNIYARIALITADYLIIPSDLKPFANQGLINVKNFIKTIDGFRRQIHKLPIEILGVLACKISTNAKFVKYNLGRRLEAIPERYGIQMMESIIYEREDLAKCSEQIKIVGEMEIADPVSVLDFKPDSVAAQEFEVLAMEVLRKIGIKPSGTSA
jgi:chromosome partitioning protein